MPLWIKLAAVAVFILVMVGLHYGITTFGKWAGPEVGVGFVLGMGVTMFFWWMSLLIDRRDKTD